MFSLTVSDSRWLGALAVTSVCCATGAQAQTGRTVDYALPSQALAQSLQTVSLRSGVSVIFSSELVRGRRAPPLRGRFTAREAAERLVRGTGLSVELVGDALVVGAPNATHLSGATADAPQADIVVTGSNLRGGQATAALIRITREQIDQSGATSVEQLMRRVPQNTQGGVNQENAGVVLQDQDVTDQGAGLNLRGLGQRATLTLVDGRRLAPSGTGAYVDISLIPLSAIERVEILPDGASAVYGSDAVGGVVNFVLRRGGGAETSLLAGLATRGGGQQIQASQSVAPHWGTGSALLAYEFRREDEVTAAQRPFTIGLRPGTFLLPSELRHSVLGMVDQDLGGGFRAGLTATYSTRSTDRTAFQAVAALPIFVAARAEAVSVGGQLSSELGAGWLARLDVNYGLSDTHQKQVQPGGNPLVNSRDVRNAILEGTLRVDGTLFDLPAGPVRMAVGGLSRREDYLDIFESSKIPRTPRSAERDVRSAFGEISLPLFSRRNRQPGLERLELSAAARYDRYSGTGSSFDPKLGILWSPASGVSLRASYGTSFRAPLLSETTGTYTAIYLPAAALYANPASAPPGGVGLILQGNNPDIRPETSRTWTFGAEVEPAFARGLTVSLNHYAIRFSDRIAFPAPALNLIGNPAFASIYDVSLAPGQAAALVGGAQVVLDATRGSTPADVGAVLDTRVTNTALTTTRGFDLALRYHFAWAGSQFTIDAAVTHIISFQNQLTPTAPQVRALDRPFQPLDWRGRGGIAWSRGGWGTSLFVNHADAYVDDRLPIVQRVAAYTTLDANLSYNVRSSGPAWLRGTRISLFVENLLDARPPFLAPAPGTLTGIGYDPVNASARGRFVSLQVRRTW